MAPKRSEMDAMNDPDFALEIALGPPCSTLVPQDQSKQIKFKGKYSDEVQRFILRAAHLSVDDFRIYDGVSGKLLLYSHHPGKDPFDSVDPLGMGKHPKPPRRNNKLPAGEWEAHCDVSGKNGFPSFKIRPYTMSRHGRQYIMGSDGKTFLNLSKMSKLKTKSLRSHFEICNGESKDALYSCSVDLMERTMVFLNDKDEQVMFCQKSAKTMLLNVAAGQGSETMIDIAPGCDATAMLAIFFGIKQVGQHYLKDAMDNYLLDPAKDAAQDSAVDYIEKNFGEVGKLGVHMARKASTEAVKLAREYEKFYKMFYS